MMSLYSKTTGQAQLPNFAAAYLALHLITTPQRHHCVVKQA
jgi:hypothetical protein